MALSTTSNIQMTTFSNTLEDRFKQVQRLANIGVWEYDFQHQHYYITPQFYQILGLQPAASPLKLKELLKLVHPEDRKMFGNSFKQADSIPLEIEFRILRPDGTECYLHSKREAVYDQEGYLHLTGIVQDITSRKQMEQRLKATEQQCKLIAENVKDIICYCTADGICEYISPSVFPLLGYQPEEVIGHNLNDYYHEDDRQKLDEMFQQAFNGKEIDRFVYRVRHKNNTFLWCESSVKLIYNESGIVEKIVGIGRDITERVKVEESLRRSRNNLRNAQQIAHLGHWDWNLITDEIYISDEAYRIWGIEKTRAFTMDSFLFSSIMKEDLPKVMQSITDALRTGCFQIEYQIQRPDGMLRKVKSIGTVEFLEDGRPQRFFGIVQDITEWNETLLRLEESEQRFKSLNDHNPDGVCSFELSGKITGANPAFVEILGFSVEELNQLSLADLLYSMPNSSDSRDAFIQNTLRGGFMKNQEGLFKHKDGRIIAVCYTLVPIYIHEKLTGMFAIVKDITLQKQTEELLGKSEKLSVIGQLAAGLAHEIRNPLTSLKGFIQLLQSTAREEKHQNYYSIMQSELKRIEWICSELLVLAKPQVSDFKRINLPEIIENVIALLEMQAILNNVQMECQVDQGLPLVCCNEHQIKQVLVNIMKNAIDAMPNGGFLKILVKKQEDDQVLIECIDTGKGIPEAILDKIGEPFYTTKEKGTGLGLMVSQKIIENHKGTIQFKSQYCHGTTVRITLPIIDAFSDETKHMA
ncbi:PAS domain S-box protein [Fodinisporobacter ferrooxydans]|uniref:histidine kinase n=1 Tax=Fodinisporobacter ferrooxydans TaxID=2901836 RepID=A0ABY4CR21_9BACL|nr:PAS domain S-box protein [Alicyclobacillaceae bacterium MYW30-H2]